MLILHAWSAGFDSQQSKQNNKANKIFLNYLPTLPTFNWSKTISLISFVSRLGPYVCQDDLLSSHIPASNLWHFYYLGFVHLTVSDSGNKMWRFNLDHYGRSFVCICVCVVVCTGVYMSVYVGCGTQRSMSCDCFNHFPETGFAFIFKTLII